MNVLHHSYYLNNIINREKEMVSYNNENITYLDKTFVGSWKEAVNYCNNLNYEGYSDWRLPNMNELSIIINYSNNPAVDNSFEHITGNIYWTSTTSLNDNKNAYFFNLKDGSWASSYKGNTFSFICVRSGLVDMNYTGGADF